MAERFGIAVAVALGVLVRAAPIVSAGGVVGDGGLILALVDDIRAAGMGLPTDASYNDLGIPFVYPPAALWLVAALGEMSGAATLDLLTWVPMVVSVLVLAAFAWLAMRVLPPAAAVGATLAFALMPSAYGWLVAAGGLTRGSGLLFALLAASVVAGQAAPSRPFRRAILAGAFLGVAGLCHPQAIVFGVVACAVLSLRRPIRPWLLQAGAAAATAVLVLLPWLAWLAATGGLEALVGAGQRLEPVTGIIRLLNLQFSGAPFMDVIGVAGAIGLTVSILRRAWRLPLLLLTVSLAGAGGGEFLAAVPWALLAGIGVASVIDLGRGALAEASPTTRRATALGTAMVALFLALIGALGSATDQSSKLHPLGSDVAAAMRWVATETSADVDVLVPTAEVWGYDEVSEWLPALAERNSIGTVQGAEWLGRAGFERQLSFHEALLNCAGAVATCYRDLDPDAMLFVPKGNVAGPFSPDDCCPALRMTLADAGYSIVFDGPGATVAMPPP
jgi:hypothetical protein